MRAADNECDIQCNLMWDGFGRWVGSFKWKPYINFTREDYSYLANQPKQHDHTVGQVFKECNNTYNWIYPKTLYELTETCSEVNLHVPRVLDYFRQVLERKNMGKDSALLLNAGAHYIKTTSFQSYKQVIVALISEIKKLYKGNAIWKSTTAIHGQTADIMGAFRRFTTNHRIQLYNAFANSAMCASDVRVLDVYAISDSYPPGTKDGIHYNNEAFNPVIELLERYFSS
ncbi:hypothetical protein ACROYT_G022585 [Oculina patagonica]